MHLVHPSLGPAFLCHCSLNFVAEGFNIFRVGKKIIERIRERLNMTAISGP